MPERVLCMKTRVSGVPYPVDLPEGMTRWQVFASGLAIGAVMATLVWASLVKWRDGHAGCHGDGPIDG